MMQSEVKRIYLGIIEATIASVRKEFSTDPDESVQSQLTLLEQYWSKRLEDREFEEDPEAKVAPAHVRGGKRTRDGKGSRQGRKKSAKQAETRATSASELSSKANDDETNVTASAESLNDSANVSAKTSLDPTGPDSSLTTAHPLKPRGKANEEPVLSIENVEVTPATTLPCDSAVPSHAKGSSLGPSGSSKIHAHQLRSAGDVKEELAVTDDNNGCVEPHLLGGPTAAHSSNSSEQQSRPQRSCVNAENKNAKKSDAKCRVAALLGSSKPVPTDPNELNTSTTPSDKATGEGKSKLKPKNSPQDHDDGEICSKEDLDSSESDLEYMLGRDEDEEDTDQFILAQFTGKPKMRNVCKFTLRNGLVCIRGRDYLFQKATCLLDSPSK